MRKTSLLYALLFAVSPLMAGDKNPKDLPKDHLLTIENETGHKLFIIEEKSFKKLNPQEAVVLYWKEPLSKGKERTIRIYYGGNVKDGVPQLDLEQKKKSRRLSRAAHKASLGSDPILIAQLRTNQPGTITLSYDQNGILKMERL